VVISTVQRIPDVTTKLLILISSTPTEFDTLKGIVVDAAGSDHLIQQNGMRIPIYGKLASLRGQGQPLAYGREMVRSLLQSFLALRGRS